MSVLGREASRLHFDLHSVFQLKNSLRDDLCLDQGPDTDNVPIMYLCHGMTPQVSKSAQVFILLSSALSYRFESTRHR